MKKKMIDLQTIPLNKVPVGGVFVIKDLWPCEHFEVCQKISEAQEDGFCDVNDLSVSKGDPSYINGVLGSIYVFDSGVKLPLEKGDNDD